MAIEQKIRSLYCGLPAGLQFQEVDGKTVLPLSAVPFELERTIENWLEALPEELRADALRSVEGKRKALTIEGWCAFVSWMLASLSAAQAAPEFRQRVAERAQKSFRD